MSVISLTVNLFCRDHQRCFGFYQALLGGREVEAQRSPIFRALDFDSFQLGFHADDAVALLEAGPWRAHAGADQEVAAHYPNFNLARAADVDAVAARVAGLGGRVVKGPYRTYYQAWQAVLADPEGHFFRVNAMP
jgi:predicted enzyme related to lactoylglutathione lyase